MSKFDRLKECEKCGYSPALSGATLDPAKEYGMRWHCDAYADTSLYAVALGTRHPSLGSRGLRPPRCGREDRQFAGEHLHFYCPSCGWNWSESTEDKGPSSTVFVKHHIFYCDGASPRDLIAMGFAACLEQAMGRGCGEKCPGHRVAQQETKEPGR
jgi:hypothetical protein